MPQLSVFACVMDSRAIPTRAMTVKRSMRHTVCAHSGPDSMSCWVLSYLRSCGCSAPCRTGPPSSWLNSVMELICLLLPTLFSQINLVRLKDRLGPAGFFILSHAHYLFSPCYLQSVLYTMCTRAPRLMLQHGPAPKPSEANGSFPIDFYEL